MTTYHFQADGTETLRDLLDRLADEVGRQRLLDRPVPRMTATRALVSRAEFAGLALRAVAGEVERTSAGTARTPPPETENADARTDRAP